MESHYVRSSSRGKNNSVNNKLTMELMYLFPPQPPPSRRRPGRWHCRRPASTCCAAPSGHPGRRHGRRLPPPPIGNVGLGWDRWVRQGGGGTVVETKSHGTKGPRPSRAYEYAQKNVTWKDALFPRQPPISSPSPRMAK